MNTLVRRRPSDDGGYALVAVMGVMASLTAFLLGSLGFAIQNLAPSRQDQDVKAALAAAQAGVEEYLARLNANDTYWTNGGVDASNPAYVSTAGPGPSVQGTGGVGASYKYELLSTAAETARTAVIRMKVTGTSQNGRGTRDLVVELSPISTTNYVYFSDVEAVDPSLYATRAVGFAYRGGEYAGTVTADPARVDSDCRKYYYAGRSAPRYTARYGDRNYEIRDYCQNIQWTSGDVVAGDLHSNDALLVNGSPTFQSRVTDSAWPTTGNPAPAANKTWWGSGTPNGNRPRLVAARPLPATNAQLRTYTDHTDPATPGCRYAGGTRIVFAGDRMKVLSPATTAANTPSRCFNVGNRANEQTISPIPPVIYVDNAATCNSSVPSVGYPRSGESLTRGATTDYDCKLGNAYVSGVVDGQVNIGTANDIVVTGNLTYAAGTDGDDVVGLTPQNRVWVYHPVDSEGRNLLSTAATVRNIDAAIFAVGGSFVVQNWGQGAALSAAGDTASKLNIRGSIAQRFRGPVGTGDGNGGAATGYLKNYVYDQRLRVLRPPYFLRPERSPWTVTKTSD